MNHAMLMNQSKDPDELRSNYAIKWSRRRCDARKRGCNWGENDGTKLGVLAEHARDTIPIERASQISSKLSEEGTLRLHGLSGIWAFLELLHHNFCIVERGSIGINMPPMTQIASGYHPSVTRQIEGRQCASRASVCRCIKEVQ